MDFLYAIDDVLTQEECEKYVKYFEDSNVEEINDKHRKYYRVQFDDKILADILFNKVKNYIPNKIRKISKYFFWNNNIIIKKNIDAFKKATISKLQRKEKILKKPIPMDEIKLLFRFVNIFNEKIKNKISGINLKLIDLLIKYKLIIPRKTIDNISWFSLKLNFFDNLKIKIIKSTFVKASKNIKDNRIDPMDFDPVIIQAIFVLITS